MEQGLAADAVRIVGQAAATLADHIVDLGEVGEAAVGDDLVDQRPEALGRLEFRGIGRQEFQLDPLGHREIGSDMPTGAVENQNDPPIWPGADLSGEGGQDPAKHRCVYRIGQEPGCLSRGWPDKAVDPQPTEAVMAKGDRAPAAQGPDPARHRLEPQAMLIEGPDLRKPTPRTAFCRLD